MFWVWELTTKDGNPQLALRQKAPLVGLRDVRSLQVSSAGTLILVAAGNEVYVWRKEEGKDSFRVVGSFARPASGVALSPDERLALSCGRDGLPSGREEDEREGPARRPRRGGQLRGLLARRSSRCVGRG